MKYRWLIFFSLLGGLFLYTLRQVLRFMPGHPVLAVLLTGLLFVLMFFWQFMARAGVSRLDTIFPKGECRCYDKPLASVVQLLSKEGADPVAVFSEVRRRKDNFR